MRVNFQASVGMCMYAQMLICPYRYGGNAIYFRDCLPILCARAIDFHDFEEFYRAVECDNIVEVWERKRV